MMPAAAASTPTVRVLLFASYAELLGRDTIELALEHPATVATAIKRLRGLPGADRLPARLFCALNLSHASPDEVLSPGDELAILPPLSGG